MTWLPASINRTRYSVYVPRSHYLYGYVNGGGPQQYDWLMVDSVKPGFYCTWKNLYYRPSPGHRIFRLDPKWLGDVCIHKETGFFMGKESKNFVRFFPMSVNDLVPEIFSS